MSSICSNGPTSETLRLFLSGDVMLGRGVDQILMHHVDPVLYEGYVNDARVYVQLAVEANGQIPSNRSVDYIWGDAIDIFSSMKPDLKIINLETAVTNRGDPWPRKGINYRVHPSNVPVLSTVGIDCCILSNNHVLDWGYTGFDDTLQSLAAAGIKVAGAGQTLSEAQAPVVFDLTDRKSSRVIIVAAASPTAGIPESWAAEKRRPGVNFVDESQSDLKRIDQHVAQVRQTLHKIGRKPNDIVIYSIHWGGNWGWNLERGQRYMARKLIDEADVNLIHGHSSHHIKGVEVYKNKLITYGCGDLITDYEGIRNYDDVEYRGELSFMYFVDFNVQSGNLSALYLVPMRLVHMQIKKAKDDDEKWLFDIMKRECSKIGHLDLQRTNSLAANAFSLIY